MNWQCIVNEVVKEAMSAKWRDYALSRLPQVPGWTLQKPKGFDPGSAAIYFGTTEGGIQVKVTVDKMKGVWRVENNDPERTTDEKVTIEDNIVGLDQESVEFALNEAMEAMEARDRQQQVDRT